MHKAIGAFELTLRDFAETTRLEEHEHDAPFATVIVAGHLIEEERGRSRTGNPFDVIVHGPGERHANRFSGRRTRCLRIQSRDAFHRTVALSSPATSSIATKIMREFQHPDALSAMVLEAAMLELFVMSEREREPSTEPQWLACAAAIVEERFADALSLGDIAAELGVHPSTLAREFRRHHGTTPGERIRMLRVEYARQRLASDAPLHDIAADAGFADQSHFTRAFRRATGTTPARYRKALRS